MVSVKCYLAYTSLPQSQWQLEIEVKWRKGISAVLEVPSSGYLNRLHACEQIFDCCYPDLQPTHFSSNPRNVSWSPKDFYEHVHVPDPHSLLAREPLRTPDLTSQLYPFQARAVRWLLSREQVQQDSNGQISQFSPIQSLPTSFKQCQDNSGNTTYRSRLLLQVLSQVEHIPEQFNGGILCEEMGLGKTVELISLISLHRFSGATSKVMDEFSGKEVTTCKATLIITPASIVEQWMQELERHAPSLKILHYKGIKHVHNGKRTREELTEQDVVLTTYTVLASEIHHAVGPPERSMRHEQKYKPKQSVSYTHLTLPTKRIV